MTPGLQAADTPSFYYKIEIESAINPVSSSYLKRALEKTKKDNAAGLIIRLNTPGGLMTSMEEMTSAIMRSSKPVLVWVGPTGARAASAGVFITYSAHVSAMSKGTRIGAAHPVSGGGKDIGEDMKEKVVNDASAQLRVMARRRDRSETVAEKFVRESLSVTASEALEKGVIDLIAASPRELLDRVKGQKIILDDGTEIKLPETSEIRNIASTWKEDFLNTLVNPNLVYILLALGMWGLIYEFSNPGLGLGGAAGGTCLLLALYGLSVLPVNYAGLGLILLGLTLMILDLFVPSYGVLSLGGLTSFILGSVMLFETKAFSVSIGLIIGVAVATLVFILVAGYLVIKNWSRPPASGDESFIGDIGVVKKELDPRGMILVRGEIWQAESKDDSKIEKGIEVRVHSHKRNRLIVAEIAD